jgi:hypothetical protein
VNGLRTNDDPDVSGSVLAKQVNGRWRPPEVVNGFFPPDSGFVYRWKDGVVTNAEGYYWYPQPQGNYANGTIYNENHSTPADYYRAATVFYCNRFDLFFTAQGDASTRNIETAEPEFGWQPLTFHHDGRISRVTHAGDQEHLAVRAADWINQLLPNNYRRDSEAGITSGGLGGLLPILIALIAFSCDSRDSLHKALIHDRAWRGNRWVRHSRPSGSECRNASIRAC